MFSPRCGWVYVIDEADRFGWAYGTLPGHPEEGEELFMVKRTAEGKTEFEIVAFSKPVDPLARVPAPVTRLVQRATPRRYLEALKKYSAPA